MGNWFRSLSIRWKLQFGFFLVTMITTVYNRMLASHELGKMVEIAQKELGLNLDDIVRVNIKGKLLFYTKDGQELTYGLKKSHVYTRPGCLHCPDFAAEHADISFGGLGQGEGWTLTIIRTDKGQDVWNRAVADGVVEWKPGSEDQGAIDLMQKLAVKSRERWRMDTAWSGPGVFPMPEPAEA